MLSPGAWHGNGPLIPAPGSAVGRQTFQEWLDAIDAV
ncbi:hypothetical protein J2T23_003260 [Pseudarthrobacter niigatensis]|uniref:Uncharacterized protein n=1 Tax=Pseudarthrobacter niigatensis TaxID=369935 RepID=A0AAJ1SU71_9MICC|nr:hypothetical protein [Pseudarthrobacter niigatensis]MDQ0267167.1 hypothetical protein [Pseudarthrobacter niigatensis]